MDTLDRSYEPMDVDISGSSLNKSLNSFIKLEKLDIEDNESPVSGQNETCVRAKSENCVIPGATLRPAKRLHVNLTPLKPKRRLSRKTALCSMLAIFVSYFTYNYLKVQCANDLNTNEINKILFKKMYGQNLPAQMIMHALEDSSPRKLIVFYGSTGVGKTYAISLILDLLWDYANVYHYTMPSFKLVFPNCVMAGLIMCPSSIFVLDGLNGDDLNIKPYIKEVVDKSVSLDKKIIVFLLYNCDTLDDFNNKCDESFLSNLETTYSDINAKQFYIKFNKLSEDNLISCITDELEILKYGGDINMTDVLINFDVALNGCKSVHRKIKSLIKGL